MKREKMNRRDDRYPSPQGQRINFSIEKSVLIKIIILIFTLFLILGCTSNPSSSKKGVFCYDGYNRSNGWISAETSYGYWVVGENGKVIEYSKSDCSIGG